MARPMRRQLASFSSKEITLLMDATWPFSPRFLRVLGGDFTGIPERFFQCLREIGPLVRRQELADAQKLAMTPQGELAGMFRRIVHLDPHPIGIEGPFAPRLFRKSARDAEL